MAATDAQQTTDVHAHAQDIVDGAPSSLKTFFHQQHEHAPRVETTQGATGKQLHLQQQQQQLESHTDQ